MQIFFQVEVKKTKYNSVYCDPQPIYCGVPQGIILGPLLFLAMVNELANDESDRFKFVDDLSVLELGEKSVSSEADRIMASLSRQAEEGKMIVNREKSLILTFSFLRDSSSLALQNVSGIMNIKLFGINLTHDLKWEKQTQEMIKRANLGILF